MPHINFNTFTEIKQKFTIIYYKLKKNTSTKKEKKSISALSNKEK